MVLGFVVCAMQADKESGTRSAVQQSWPAQRPSLPPFAGRLCRSKSARDSRTPSPQIKEKRSRPAVGCYARCACSTTASSPCWFIPSRPPQGGEYRPGGGVPAPPSVPRIRALNIIPSELCNCRRHRQCPASRESAKHTPGARRNGLQGVRLHNSDYVKCLRRQGARVIPSNLPGEAAAGEGLAAVAGSVPALCQPRTWQRNRGPNFPNSSTRCNSAGASVSLHRHHPLSASYAAKLRVGPSSKASSRDKPASSPLTPFLQGRV